MNTVMMTQTTTHKGVTSTKLCTIIEGKKFCEVQDGNAHDVGLGMLGIFGGIVFWVLLSFVTFKVLMGWLKLEDLSEWEAGVAIFSLLAPLGYIGLFLAVLG
jgi:hypothetical protein